ncbi:unnamed protein product [Paramecium octaurelia]|uniref:Uncharacterized protein n=1 Tax=Paramecium octaurelia TaxID=43137 RepID=A0A8S1Y6Z9_PAROT|nr:unnamed protein product [Paramecium octaurelia]
MKLQQSINQTLIQLITQIVMKNFNYNFKKLLNLYIIKSFNQKIINWIVQLPFFEKEPKVSQNYIIYEKLRHLNFKFTYSNKIWRLIKLFCQINPYQFFLYQFLTQSALNHTYYGVDFAEFHYCDAFKRFSEIKKYHYYCINDLKRKYI